MAACVQPLSLRRQCWLAARTLALCGVFLGLFAWGYHWLVHWYAVGKYDALELARMGDLEAMEELARYRPQRLLARSGDYEETPLHAAAGNSQLEVAHFLLHHGADVNAVDYCSRQPLQVALFRNTEAWLQSGALPTFGGRKLPDFGDKEVEPCNLVHSADLDMASVLLDHGADVNAGGLCTSLMVAVYANDVAAIIFLLGHGADVNGHPRSGLVHQHMRRPTCSGDTALWAAVNTGNSTVAELLLNRGADVNAASDFGGTVLGLAAQTGALRVARLLLSRGADPNVVDRYGRRALHVAATEDRPRLAFLLLTWGADVNATDTQGRTPLHCVAGDDSSTARLLLQCGANVDLADRDGRTPVHCAAQKADRYLVALLLARGATVNARDHAGQTPLDLARSPEAQAELKKHGGRHGSELPAPPAPSR